MAKSERFMVKKTDSGSLELGSEVKIIVDKKTGVNYLWVMAGYAGGLTPLLDCEGKPIVTETDIQKE